MRWSRVVDAEPVVVKFGGDVEQIDVNTFTKVILDYTTVLNVACAEGDPNVTVRTTIRSVRPGCLMVDLGIVTDVVKNLFSDPKTALETVSGAVTIASGFYELKKHLSKHGRASSFGDGGEGGVRVVTEDGEAREFPRSVVDIYVNHPDADTAVNSTFETLDADPRIESFSIGGDDGFSASRDEFNEIAVSPSYEGDDVVHEEVEASLSVVKPYLGSSTTRKWEFLYQGIKVSANITDAAFMSRISDVSFKVGMVMSVRMDITRKFDPTLHAYVNKSYSITEVRDISEPQESPRLF